MASDITYIRTHEGFLYLAVVIDLFSRRVIGWSMQGRTYTDLPLQALLMAVWRRKPKTKVQMHSDSHTIEASFRAVCLRHRSTAVGWRREVPRCGLTRTLIDRRVFPWTCRPPGNTSRLGFASAIACDPRRA